MLQVVSRLSGRKATQEKEEGIKKQLYLLVHHFPGAFQVLPYCDGSRQPCIRLGSADSSRESIKGRLKRLDKGINMYVQRDGHAIAELCGQSLPQATVQACAALFG